MRSFVSRSLLVVPLLVAGGWTVASHHDAGLEATSFAPIERTGTIDSWSVGAKGAVTLRLNGRHEGEEFTLWFTTPGSQTDTTRFEHLVLAIVLAAIDDEAGEFLVTAHSDTGNEVKGKEFDDALPLDRISHFARGARAEDKER